MAAMTRLTSCCISTPSQVSHNIYLTLAQHCQYTILPPFKAHQSDMVKTVAVDSWLQISDVIPAFSKLNSYNETIHLFILTG